MALNRCTYLKMRIVLLTVFALLFCGTMLYGQDAPKKTIATLPFKGSPAELLEPFYQIFLDEFPKITSEYIPVPISMEDLPPDIPEGGYPPYVCPSPSLVRSSTYAMTGELNPSEDKPGATVLRLYLWGIEGSHPIYFDSLVAGDIQEYLQSLPLLVQLVLSWLPEDPPPVVAAEEAPPPPPPPPKKPAIPENWLYAGARAGISLRFYDRDNEGPFSEAHAANGYNFNATFHLSVHLFSFMDFRPEIIYNTDRAPFTYNDTEYPFVSQFLTVPMLLKFSIHTGPLSAGILGGPYLIIPLGQMKNDKFGGGFDYDMDAPWGYTIGINLGAKAGPGRIFLDIRWSSDLDELTKSGTNEQLFRRSGISFNLGYEFGFFEKNAIK